MANSENCFRINTPSIAYEYLEDEVVILNLAKDRYYSTAQIGLEIWKLLEKGFSKESIVQKIQKKYISKEVSILDSIETFMHQLQTEEIILPNKCIKHLKSECASDDSQGHFIPPILEINENMHDLLLLEPVQEISEMTETCASDHKST